MVGERRETESQGKMYKIKFLASGGDFREVECRDNEYILDAADRQGVDLPATCRGGICGACVAKVCTGSVDMSDILDLEFTVNAKEQAEVGVGTGRHGMTLICMARPLADCNIEIQSDYGYSLGNEWKGATGAFNATPIPLIEKKK
ncbi:hypothetical protein FOA52_013218 [Chlamydomonas sp. UWO 241]|nr:hypothetical protein FOA52_013218 [Chlamydomonas sp. UWO 241]